MFLSGQTQQALLECSPPETLRRWATANGRVCCLFRRCSFVACNEPLPPVGRNRIPGYALTKWT